MGVTEIHDLAAVYALDALEPEDRWTYERHLDTCSECREEIIALRDSAVALAYASVGPEPAPELRDRILAAARAEAQTGSVVQMRKRWLLPATAGVAAVAASAAVGLGVWANSLRVAPSDERVVALVGAPGHLLVAGERAKLIVCLSDPPPGKAYAAWVIRDDRPTPAGLFAGGCRSVPVEEPVEPGVTVAVTVEDEAGVDSPQGDVLLRANV